MSACIFVGYTDFILLLLLFRFIFLYFFICILCMDYWYDSKIKDDDKYNTSCTLSFLIS